MTKAKEHADKALQLAIGARDIRAQASAMLKISAVEYRLGTVTLALRHAHEARNLARQGSDVLHEIMSIRQEVYYLVARGDYGKAAAACAEGVILVHALGLDTSSFLYRVMIILQGEVHLARTEYDSVRKVNEPLATSAHKLQGEALGVRGYALHNLALADVLTGAKDVPCILENLGAARRIFIDLGDKFGLDLCNIARMELHVVCREYPQAKAICLETVAPAGKSGDILAWCFERLGDIAFAERNFTEAFRYYVVLFAAAQKHEDMRGTTMALRCLGDIFKIDSDVDSALHSWEIALDAFTGMEVHRGRAECMLRIGDVYMERGEATTANELWKNARDLFRRCSQAEQIQRCEERILAS
jgi:tetratricopeptide (TPR) repeat protein